MRTLAGAWLLATPAFALGCSDPVDPSNTPKQVNVPASADGADLSALVRAYPPGTAFHLSGGVYRMSTSVSPKPGNSFIGDAGPFTSEKNLADWFAVAHSEERR